MNNNAIAVKQQSLDIMSLGNILSQSGYFSDARDAAQAVVKVLAGQELGVGAIASMTGIYIVKNRVTLRANLIGAIIKKSDKYDYHIQEMTGEICKVEFFENGKGIGVSEFTIQDAKTANLNGDNWRKYPRNMLFARAMSNGAKWYCPDVFSGGAVYTPDELGQKVDGDGEMVIDHAEAEAQPITADGPGDLWHPTFDEFKVQVENDFKMAWAEIKIILKDDCGIESFKSSKATEMYNCLAQVMNDRNKAAEAQPEETEQKPLFDGEPDSHYEEAA